MKSNLTIAVKDRPNVGPALCLLRAFPRAYIGVDPRIFPGNSPPDLQFHLFFPILPLAVKRRGLNLGLSFLEVEDGLLKLEKIKRWIVHLNVKT